MEAMQEALAQSPKSVKVKIKVKIKPKEKGNVGNKASDDKYK